MSKGAKRVKSGTVPQGGSKWDLAIQTTPLEEDNWKSNITYVVGSCPEDYLHIKLLGNAVAAGSRKLFTLISKDNLYEEVNELGNPKVKKTKEIPQNFEVCEACKLQLDLGDEIPLPLLAKLIKYRLLNIKQKDLKRRETERKFDNNKSEATLDQGKGKKDKGKDRAKSPKKGGKKTPEPPSAKDGSKLRKRGDEDEESKFLDDEPDDGAQHYIILYGFHQPHLFSQLCDLGINIDCILRISSQDYTLFHQPTTESTDKDDKTINAELALKEERRELKKELKSFWKDIELILQKNSDSSKLHDVAIQDYEVKSILWPSNIEDPEQKLAYSTTLFEDVACKIYDLIDARRLYQTYLEYLKLSQIPVIGQPPATGAGEDNETTLELETTETDVTCTSVDQTIDGQSTVSAATPGPGSQPPISATNLPPDGQLEPPSIDMRYYNDLMNCVPQESVSIPLIMNCMLEQVVASEENKEPPSEQQPVKRSDGLNHEVAAHLSSMAFKLALTEEEHKSLEETMELPEIPSNSPRQPLLMNFHDQNTVRCHQLKSHYSFDPQKVEDHMLQFSPFSRLVQLQRPTTALAKERAARLQELIHFCSSDLMSLSEIDRAFKQFLFESMDLTSTDSNGFIMTREGEGLEHTAIPWDDPYPFFKGMIPHHEKHLNIPISSSSSSSTDNNSNEPLHRESRSSRVEFTDSNEKIEDTTPNRSRPTSSESKKSILKPRSRSQSPVRELRSRSNSVHFMKEEGEPLPLTEDETKEFEDIKEEVKEKTIEDSMMDVVDAQKRNLDSWCYAEHFESNVLLQVLNEALYFLPFMNTYYNKRDHSLMLVLHAPHNSELQNHVDWHTELHSNMGFRNYMEYIRDSIDDWLKEKQAEYDAKMLSHEIEKLRTEDEASAKASQRQLDSPKKSARGLSKSPKSSRNNSPEKMAGENTSNSQFIRAGSLKAQKEEADKLLAEEAEKERQLTLKRSKSAQKKDEKEEKKRPGSRGSAKSKTSQRELDVQPEAPPLDLQDDEKYWPFEGFDVGNNLIHVSGVVTSLFPSDGGQIRIERTEFVQGTTSINSTVLKDGHVFCVHLLDPKEDEVVSEDEVEEVVEDEGQEKKDLPEKCEQEKLEKDNNKKVVKSAFGSVTATLSDGMTIAVSQFGPTGQAVEGKKYEPEPYLPPMSSPTPVSQPASPGKGKKPEKGKEKGAPTPDPPHIQTEDGETDEDKKDDSGISNQSFQQLFLTCPDGLNIRYYLESSIGIKSNSELDRRLLVKQSYPYKSKGVQSCESGRKRYMLEEVSRVITSDGTVVKTLVDGTIEVLYADGTISCRSGKWPSTTSRASSPHRNTSGRSGNETPTKKPMRSKGSSKNLSPKKQEDNQAEEEKKSRWITTYPNGEKYSVRADGTVEDLKPVMICLASDPETKQSMATRDDKVVTVSYPDGTTIVEHSDGTRVTTYYCESQVANEDEEELVDTPRSAETRTTKFVKVECPAYATVEFNCSTSENLTIFGNSTSVNVFPDGFYMIQHCEGGRIQVDTEGTFVYYNKSDGKNKETSLLQRELQYVLRHNADVICETVDTEGNIFNVKHTGDFSVMLANGEDGFSSESSIEEQARHPDKITHYNQHAPRFFIVHADGSGTELLRPKDVAEYLDVADKNPATAVCKDPVSDYPGVTGITALKPYVGGPSQVWFKNYDLDSIIPNGIRSRDLTNLPSKEFKKSGSNFGTNVGQGLAVGSAKKSPTGTAMLKCPEVLELRQLVQYEAVNEQLRVKLCGGLRQYAEYVMARNKEAEMMQVNDPRTVTEQNTATDLNTTVVKQQDQPSYDPGTVKDLYEMATAPQMPSPPPTPQPKRKQSDWEKDQREIAQEMEGRAMLRNKTIPNYFDSELGKAFLLTQAKNEEEVLTQLSEDPRHDGSEVIRADPKSETPSDGQHNQSRPQIHSENSDQSVSSTSPGMNGASQASVKLETPVSTNTAFTMDTNTTPSGIRPLNPTPGHATGQGSPASVRPDNPTPSKNGKTAPYRPGNPTPKRAGGITLTPSDGDQQSRRKSQVTIKEEDDFTNLSSVPSKESDMLTRSLKLNVIGEPRSESVLLPESIMGARPNAEKNIRFLEIEEPVRRKVNNTVITGATFKGKKQLENMRGLNVLPDKVNFGILREGYTYSYNVYLKNTGIDTCRFKIKQPPPATGLKVIYKPGPIAAGMRCELLLELYAIAVGVEGESGVGGIQHNLQITTETDSILLPITATILTAHEYEQRISQNGGYQRTAGTSLISTKPPSVTGIIRPRKDNLQVGITA